MNPVRSVHSTAPPAFIRPAFAACAALLALLALGSGAEAQSIVRGEVAGRVVDASGTAIFEAAVAATNVRSGVSHFATTERDGSFQIKGLPPGEFTLLVEALGRGPVLYVDVPVRPDRTLEFEVTLEAAPPPVESVDTVSFSERTGVRMDEAGGRWFSRDELVGTPEILPGLSEISALASGWDAHGGSQGLPGTLSGIYVDGLAFTPALHPFRTTDPLGLAALPRTGLGQVSLLEGAADVEWSGSPGGYTSVGTRTASGSFGGAVEGYGSNESGWTSESFEGEKPDGLSWWGSGSADVPLPMDDARMLVAAEGLTVRTPRWLDAPAGFVSTLSGELGDPTPAVDPRWIDETRSFSALARLDWTLEQGIDLLSRVNVNRAEGAGSPYFGAPGSYGSPPPFEATDISSLVGIRAPVTDRVLVEFRGGFERSERAFGAEAGAAHRAAVDPTRILGDRVLVGNAPGSDGRVLRTALVGSPIVHLDFGAHRFKGGVDFAIPSYEYDFAPPLAGSFFFSDAGGLGDRRGAFTGVQGGGGTSFDLPRVGGFFQYRWSPRTELVLTSGVRWDEEFLPTDEISFNERWFGLTGLSNTDLSGSASGWGGRLGVTWDVQGRGSTLVHGSFEAHSGRVDPGRVHEAVLLTGPVEARRALGELGSWPGTPGEGVTGEGRPVLALLDPDVRPPLTTRAVASFAQSLGAGTTVRFSGTYRRTQYLARRTDLNRLALPVADSNLGRPVYGELAKEGSVVQAVPSSNRRFQEFDRVWGLNSDGWSEYTAASVALEHSWGVLDGFGEYTFSRTEDNWVGAGVGLPEGRLGPGLDPGEGSDGSGDRGARWEEGVSDFDRPHRLVVGLDATFDVPGIESATLGGTFRLQSGAPFTPTYPAGTDVNGDGSSLNDPAFVPDDPAVRDLAGEWECLDEWIGRIVERNACRAPEVYTLDVRLRLTLLEWSGGVAELLLEGFNVLDARTGPRDAALMMVDPDAPITGQGTESVNIPTVVNPGFGEVLFPGTTGRRARIGLRVGAP